MIFLRNLLIIGLVACVCYAGYFIYQSNQHAQERAKYEQLEEYNELPPLYVSPINSDASQQTSDTNQIGGLAPTAMNQGSIYSNVKIEKNSSPRNPAISELETSSVFTSGTPLTVVSNNNVATKDIKPKLLTNEKIEIVKEQGNSEKKETAIPKDSIDFQTAWNKAKSYEEKFELAKALEVLTQLIDNEKQLNEKQIEQLYKKLNELSATVIFQPNKHLALPAVTFLPENTIAQFSKEYQLPEELIKLINNYTEDQAPSPGDSLKLLYGPVKLKLDTESNYAVLFVGKLFAQRFPLHHKNLVPENSGTHVLSKVTDGSATAGPPVFELDNSIKLTNQLTENEGPMLGLSDGALVRLSRLIGKQIDATLIVAKPIEEKIAPMQTELTNAEVEIETPRISEPVDSLLLEVFSPTKSAQIKQQVLYGLRITNLSDKVIDDITSVSFFSEGLEPIKVDGAKGRISAGQATFQAIKLQPGEKIELTIKAEVQNSGSLVFRPEVESEILQCKLVSEVYLTAEQVAESPVMAGNSPTETR